jgi:Gamma tubulin complex component C-terminal
MLTNPKLIAAFSSLIDTCHTFVLLSETIASNAANLDADDVYSSCQALSDSFMYQIQHLMDILQVLGVAETPRLVNLLSQLDFNGYYLSIAPKAEFVHNPMVPPGSY